MAEHWRVLRYAGMEIGGVCHFASLWDWDVPGKGYVHVSPYRPGGDVRTAVAINEVWRQGENTPPEKYAAGGAAYQQLLPTRVVRES